LQGIAFDKDFEKKVLRNRSREEATVVGDRELHQVGRWRYKTHRKNMGEMVRKSGVCVCGVWLQLERARRNIKTGKQPRLKLDFEKTKNKDNDLKACSRG